ncbi:MAG: phosphatase PAP2 family protein [Patescibacteria group bacterium]
MLNINNKIFFALYNLTHKSLCFDRIIIFFADIFPYIVILIAIIFLLFHHEVFFLTKPIKELKTKCKEIALVFFSGIFAWSLASVIKIIIQAPRPFIIFPNVVSLLNETGFSFPSGHATFFMALATALFFSHKRIGYIFGIFALLIGVARIATGVHFPIDILNGFLLGILIAYLVRFLYKKLS